MSQNVSVLSTRQRDAAALLAVDELTDEQIAEKIGVNRRTLQRWKDDETFVALVDEHMRRFERQIFRAAFARKARRVQALNAVAIDVLKDLQEGDYKAVIGVTADGLEIEGFDERRVRQFRGVLDDIASEMGERQAKNNSPGGGVVVKVYTDVRLGGPSALEAEWHDAPPARSSADR